MTTQLPVIRGLTKVRNESKIIKDTLDKWAPFCTGGIYVYDDCSTDDTVKICRAHSAVVQVLEGITWDPWREKAEYVNRQRVLEYAQKFSAPEDWFVYFDADEHLYNFTNYDLFHEPSIGAIACRLFDVYVTPSDIHAPYQERQLVGPEFRTIPFFFRNDPYLRYTELDQRIVTLDPKLQIPIHGEIKHYGKGFSVEHWEETCDYYIRYWPKYAEKWRKRKGKAVHDGVSDFGNKLIKWEDRMQGFSLENQSYGKN